MSDAAMDTLPIFVPVKRVVADYGLSKSTIHRKLSAGDVRGKKLGRSTLIELASVRAFLARCADR